ncbi:MAG: phosphate-starvation-inducible PsiE family protein [bacterium]|nr:MAG: phosphate-starvation-inducible PsiE family protein [bacterium]
MITAKKIKDHYQFTPAEEKILGDLRPVMKNHRDRFGQEMMEYFMSQEMMAEFFPTEEKQKHHAMTFGGWFMRLFGGTYDEPYFQNLRKVGRVHVDISLDGHLVNATMTLVRQFIAQIVEQDLPPEDRDRALTAITKILDINLDVLTSSYRQAELKKYFLHARAETALINLLERFTHGLNLVLGLALAVVSLGVIWLFVHDVMTAFSSPRLETSVVAALGSLLIIWMMIELLSTEVQHLRGKKISINVFIGIVIVAFIRKVLIGSLQHGNLTEYGMRIGTLFILAVVYWLVTRAERS